MDGIANIARQQQSQINTTETHTRVVEQIKPSTTEIGQQIAKEPENQEIEINSKKDVTSLVNQLNTAMAPINTTLKFGVDAQDVFYVSVIDQKTNKIIRRFPAKEAQDLLPKMQEVTGILFDHKG